MVRVAFVLALAGAIAVLSGGMLFLSAGSAGSAPTGSDTTCVPSEAWTETTDWVLAAPAIRALAPAPPAKRDVAPAPSSRPR